MTAQAEPAPGGFAGGVEAALHAAEERATDGGCCSSGGAESACCTEPGARGACCGEPAIDVGSRCCG